MAKLTPTKTGSKTSRNLFDETNSGLSVTFTDQEARLVNARMAAIRSNTYFKPSGEQYDAEIGNIFRSIITNSRKRITYTQAQVKAVMQNLVSAYGALYQRKKELEMIGSSELFDTQIPEALFASGPGSFTGLPIQLYEAAEPKDEYFEHYDAIVRDYEMASAVIAKFPIPKGILAILEKLFSKYYRSTENPDSLVIGLGFRPIMLNLAGASQSIAKVTGTTTIESLYAVAKLAHADDVMDVIMADMANVFKVGGNKRVIDCSIKVIKSIGFDAKISEAVNNSTIGLCTWTMDGGLGSSSEEISHKFDENVFRGILTDKAEYSGEELDFTFTYKGTILRIDKTDAVVFSDVGNMFQTSHFSMFYEDVDSTYGVASIGLFGSEIHEYDDAGYEEMIIGMGMLNSNGLEGMRPLVLGAIALNTLVTSLSTPYAGNHKNGYIPWQDIKLYKNARMAEAFSWVPVAPTIKKAPFKKKK